jgi:hypothetical protein
MLRLSARRITAESIHSPTLELEWRVPENTKLSPKLYAPSGTLAGRLRCLQDAIRYLVIPSNASSPTFRRRNDTGADTPMQEFPEKFQSTTVGTSQISCSAVAVQMRSGIRPETDSSHSCSCLLTLQSNFSVTRGKLHRKSPRSSL